MTGQREQLTWDAFGEATRDIAREIVRDAFAPEVVVAIARGGLLPGGADFPWSFQGTVMQQDAAAAGSATV